MLCNAVIAGPATSDHVAKYVRDQVDRFGGVATWIGPVYGKEKIDFLSNVSVLAFPTKYVNEAQPNVLFEALSYGVPVATIARGCIDEDVRGAMSCVARSAETFVEEAAFHIKWLAERFNAGEWNKVRTAVVRSFVEQHKAAVEAELGLVNLLLGRDR